MVTGRLVSAADRASLSIVVECPAPVGATIRDAADESGVFINNACQSGTCGSCCIKLLAGI